MSKNLNFLNYEVLTISTSRAVYSCFRKKQIRSTIQKNIDRRCIFRLKRTGFLNQMDSFFTMENTTFSIRTFRSIKRYSAIIWGMP